MIVIYLFQAVQRNFTQGRKTQTVIAVCLYIVCRKQVPPLTLDFLFLPRSLTLSLPLTVSVM